MNKTVEKYLQVETVSLWIDGKATAAKSTRLGEVTNPATGNVIRYVPMANAADIDAAVRAAQAALTAWRNTTALRRARVNQKFLKVMQANVKVIDQFIS